jgi:hypothetical protein
MAANQQSYKGIEADYFLSPSAHGCILVAKVPQSRRTVNLSDMSQAFKRDDIFIRWMNISGSFRVKKPPVSP